MATTKTESKTDQVRFSKRHSLASLIPSRSSVPATLFAFAVLAALYFGWRMRNEYLLSAEFGLGYALGIIGGSMMLLLLIYPLRKRFYYSSFFLFSTKNWFKLHMALGILGPLFILYHCNFNLGSTNSNVALASMLLMVSSGLVGRFIYGKIHYGLYGRKARLKELQDDKVIVQTKLDDDHSDNAIYISAALVTQLQAFEQAVLKRRGLLATLFNILLLGLKTRWGYFAVIRRLKQEQHNNARYNRLSRAQKRRNLNAVHTHIATYLATVRKIAGLSFYERLFSIWHLMHLPIFFMLIITGFVHVYAVHAY